MRDPIYIPPYPQSWFERLQQAIAAFLDARRAPLPEGLRVSPRKGRLFRWF